MWFNKSKKNIYREENIGEPKHMTKAMILAEPICEKLLKKNLGRFLEQDYKFVDNGKYARFDNAKEAEQHLRQYLNGILTYLGLPLFVNLKVLFADDSNYMSKNGKAGSYQGGWANKTITIIISRSYTFVNILAIMCHECTHYFMEYNGLNWNDTDLNEERTDMMSCLIGFGIILSKGYKTIEDVEYHIGFTRTRTSKIGYISSTECDQIYEYLLYRRKKIIADRRNKEEFEKQKDKLNELLELINRFDSQIEELNPLKNSDIYSSVGKEQLSILQSTIVDIENLMTASTIKEIKELLKKAKYLRDIALCIQMANKHCEKQIGIISKLQGISN